MDVVRPINKALSYEDIQRILEGDVKITKYPGLGNLYGIDQLLPDGTCHCIIPSTKTDPIQGTGQPYRSTKVSTNTLTPTASTQIVT